MQNNVSLQIAALWDESFCVQGLKSFTSTWEKTSVNILCVCVEELQDQEKILNSVELKNTSTSDPEHLTWVFVGL